MILDIGRPDNYVLRDRLPASKSTFRIGSASENKFTFAQILEMEVKDSNGNILNDGDSVTVIKDLKVKGSSDVIKRGTKVSNIRLTDDPAEIDCRVNKTAMVLRTEFVKKV